MSESSHRDERRVEILDQAFVVFARHGFHGLTMRELARELGATTGILYHWFSGKEAIFEAILTRQVTLLVHDALTAIDPTQPHADHALTQWVTQNTQRLQQLLRVALDYHQSWPEGHPTLTQLTHQLRDAITHHLHLPPPQTEHLLRTYIGYLILHIFDPLAPPLP